MAFFVVVDVTPKARHRTGMNEAQDGFANSLQRQLVGELADRCRARRQIVATAESCTGGLIAAACTNIAGSSDWFDSGFVTYSNGAKMQLLGVSQTTLTEHGAVSAETVAQMARGAVAHSGATLACAVSGVAGPGGGSPEKPVGTVWIGWAWPGGERQQHHLFSGNRDAIRQRTVEAALQGLIVCIDSVSV
jgi:nicotinamide-nucleotide amidase